MNRVDHGEFPGELAQLSPATLATIPQDLFSDQPLIYRRFPDGFLLYSVLKNGVDDGGTDVRSGIVDGEWLDDAGDANLFDVDVDQSELVLRLPLPNVPWPEPPAGESK